MALRPYPSPTPRVRSRCHVMCPNTGGADADPRREPAVPRPVTVSRRTAGAGPAGSAHRSSRVSGPLRGRAAAATGSARTGTGAETSPAKRSRKSTGTGRGATPRRSDRTRGARPAPFVPGPSRPGRRLVPAYDLEGPRIRLGLLWFVAVFLTLGLGRALADLPLIAVLYAAVAAIAAANIVDAWSRRPVPLVRSGAMAIAGVVGLSASVGARALGATLLAAVVVGLVIGLVQSFRRQRLLVTTALVLQASLPVGVAAASVVLTMRYEIGACVILLAILMAFDSGDFIIGSGAGSAIEGPLAGGLMIVLVGAVAAIIGAPPFDGTLVWPFVAAAVVLCPLGQILASWLLPDAATRAPALRRIDSLLVLGPCWAWGVGLVVS